VAADASTFKAETEGDIPVAVAALLLWLGTAAVGSYLLLGAIHSAGPVSRAKAEAEAEAEATRPVHVPAEQHAAGYGPPARPAPVRPKDIFDPPSLQRSKADQLPGLRDLAEFAHPALAFIGFGFWLGYVVSRDRLFAAIGLGILLGAICAGLSWFAINTRARRRAVSAAPDATSPPAAPGGAPLAPSARLLVLHAAGAALTLLIVALVAARV
jgi:hypothetical protein